MGDEPVKELRDWRLLAQPFDFLFNDKAWMGLNKAHLFEFSYGLCSLSPHTAIWISFGRCRQMKYLILKTIYDVTFCYRSVQSF